MNYPEVIGFGKYLPTRILTNLDLEKMVETNDEWIVTRTGIRERHLAADDESASSMGIEAGRQALERANLDPKDVDMLIFATCTPDKLIPSSAALVQKGLGTTNAACFDLNTACSGFVFSMAVASQFIQGGAFKNILVIGSEVLSRIIDWTDRSTCVLFADGAGAVVVTRGGKKRIVPTFTLGTDGSRGEELIHAYDICNMPLEAARNGFDYLHMAGNEVFKFAVTTMVTATRCTLDKAGVALSDVRLFIPHQANRRIIDAAFKSLRVPEDRIVINIDRYGNTSSASIPIALCEALEQNRLQRDDMVVLVGFGAGLSWGAMVMQW